MKPLRFSAQRLSRQLGLVCSIIISSIATNTLAMPGKSNGFGPMQIIEGRVLDSHLEGSAIACLDINGSAGCDFGEPAAPVQGNSNFKIKTFHVDIATANLIVTNKPTGKSKKSKARPTNQLMAAPAGHTGIVTPLTTLVVARMLNTGEDAATADTAMISALGISCALDCDYSADAATAAAASVASSMLAATQEQIDGDATASAALKSLYAIDRELHNVLNAGNTLADVVVTTGDIYAVDLGDPDNPRNAAAYAGDVEVIAGTGYHGTVFDSADNKCQHCHNDLYDTWQKSMHAQSWKDPIFQSKYQDFLRLHISKIGATGATADYTEGTFKKVAQVCIKCHAPTAYYSGDYKVELTVLSTDPEADYTTAKADNESNLAPAYNPDIPANVVSVSKNGKVYQASYHVGNKHNREGINCAFCHSVETIRMMNDTEGDFGEYTLKNPIKVGPIGPVVYDKGETLHYNADATVPDMNAFFVLIGPEKQLDYGNSPQEYGEFDVNKAADGRFVMKSTPLGDYTGGPFYGPYGVTGLDNSRDDDTLDREALVKQSFIDAGRNQHFEDYGKAMCLGCHQRSSSMTNPVAGGSFMELCTTWTAMSDGVGDNYTSSPSSPKCQKCHMERVDDKIVLHKWDDPDSLFTAEDGVTPHFDPDSGFGPVALGYLNNHAFMGANKKDFGLGKIKSGFDSDMSAVLNGSSILVETTLLNKTGHMFPGAHPMRRVLTRVVVTDANGDRVPFASATGNSSFETITNTLATLPGETVYPGKETVDVEYDPSRNLNYQGQVANLDGSVVPGQKFDTTLVTWTGTPDATVPNAQPTSDDGVTWYFTGTTTVKKIIDDATTGYFTRIYGRETGKKTPDGIYYVVRPGFDSRIVTDNRLEPNERETYSVSFDASSAAFPVTVAYKVYYLKKGGNGKFPADPATGFLKPGTPGKAAIYEVYSKDVVIE